MNSFSFFSSELIVHRILILSIVVNKIFFKKIINNIIIIIIIINIITIVFKNITMGLKPQPTLQYSLFSPLFFT